jgi:DNA-binding HxlR family transcriptional regulator
MPYTIENELTETGCGILAVAEAVEAWLARGPQGPIELRSEPATGGIRALIGGWESTVLRALAAQPLTLTELNGVILEISYPSIERRLSAMLAARQVERLESGPTGRPYAVSEWGRQAVGPLIAAGRCERLHLAKVTTPLTRSHVEADLLLAVPLASLPDGHGGRCTLAIAADDNEGIDADGPATAIHVEIEGGRVVSCVRRPKPETGTWVRGTVAEWTDSIIDGQARRPAGRRRGCGAPMGAHLRPPGCPVVSRQEKPTKTKR